MTAMAHNARTFFLISATLYLFCKMTDIDCNATNTVATCIVHRTGTGRTSVNPCLAFGQQDDTIFPWLDRTETYTDLGAKDSGSGQSRQTTRRLRNVLLERGGQLDAASTVPYVKNGLFLTFVDPKVNLSPSYWTLSTPELHGPGAQLCVKYANVGQRIAAVPVGRTVKGVSRRG
jgi:hypothetical protein